MKIIKTSFLKSNVIKAGFWYTFGNFLLKGAIFITLPLFTRILSTVDFGIYNTYISYETIISLIIGLGLHGSVKAAKYDFENKFQQFLSSCMSIIIMVFFVLLISINVIYPYISHSSIYSPIIINILIIHSFASAVIQFISASYIIENKYKNYMAISFFTTLINIFLSLILCTTIFNNQRCVGRILGNAIPFILVGIILSIVVLRKGRTLFCASFYKYALKIGIPLIPHTLSLVLLAQLDRIMIQKMIGYSEAGIYSFAYTMIAILSIVMNSLDNAWGPWFYSNLNSKNYIVIKNKNKIYVILFTCITIIFTLVIPELIKIASDKSYWESLDSVIPLIISVFFNYLYLFPVNLEYFYKKTGYISMGTIISVGINFVLNLFFIKYFGYKAAGYTTAVSNMFLFLIHWNIAKKIDKNEIVDYKILIYCLILVLLFSFITVLFKNYWCLRYIILLILVFYIFIKYKKFKDVMSSI